MKIVKLDCDNVLERFKESFEDLLLNHPNLKDFIVIAIDKDNGVQVRKSDNALPLVTTMSYMIQDILATEVKVSNFSFDHGKFVKTEDEE